MQKTVMKKGFIIFSIIFLFAFIFFINQGSGAGGDPTLLPAVSINANPTSITPGGSSTLSWSATSGTPASCYKSWGGGFTPLIGSEVVYPTTTTTYVLTCINEEGESSASATVTVSAIPLTVSLTANPSSINQGSSSTLSWSSSAVAAECVGTGFFSGGATSGSVTVTPSSTTTYSINCNDAVYNHVIDTATVQVIPTQYTLTISLTSPGSVTFIDSTTKTCSYPGCTYSYNPNAMVEFLYTSPLGGSFSGACTGGPCTIYMTSNKSVSINFPVVGGLSVAPDILSCGSTLAGTTKSCGSFTLSKPINADDITGTASVSSPFSCGANCGYNIQLGTTSTSMPFTFSPISAFPYSKTVTFSVDGGSNVYATITGTGTNPTITSYNLTVSKSGTGSGTVTSSPAGINCGIACSALYDSGTYVSLFASAPTGSEFTGWSGACSGTDPTSCSVLMSSAKSVTATFNAVTTQYSLAVSITSGTGSVSDNAGHNCSSSCTWLYNANTAVTLTTSPTGGVISGACSGTTTCSFNIGTSNKVAGVAFSTTPIISVTPSSLSCGSEEIGVSASCGSFIVTNTGSGTLIGTASVSTPFSCSSGCNYSLTSGQTQSVGITFTPSSAITSTGTVTFTGGGGASRTVTGTGTTIPPPTYTLTVSKSGSGTGTVTGTGINCGSDCTEVYNDGQSVTLTATAALGSVFAGWSGGGCSGTGTCTVTMDVSKTVTATFNLITTNTLTVTKSGLGSGSVTSSPAGISCGSDCSESYITGTSVTLTAAAFSGSIFVGWTGACTGTNPICTVIVNSDKTAIATFDSTDEPITCSITSAYWSTSQTIEGTQVTMTATGNGYCVGWTVNFEVKRGSTSITSLTNNVWSANTISRTWTATPASSTLYYFIASVTTLGTSKTSGNLLVTALGEEPPVDQCLLVSFCSEYTSQTNCNADSCSVGGVSAPSTIDCSDPDVDCSCWWNTTTSSCSPLQTITSPIYGEGTCQITQDTADDCSDGFLSFSWTGVWDGNPAHESRIECETGGTDIIPCPAQIQLPFFSTYNVIAIIVIALLIYLIISARRKQGKSKSSKKRKR